MLSSLITAFRQQYPRGSLVSELLTIHDGQYVVRVMVGLEGVTLAAGLGANPRLEMAEDIACTRALERLVGPISNAEKAKINPPMAAPGETVHPLPEPPLPKPSLAESPLPAPSLPEKVITPLPQASSGE
ncbi:MAG: hypothetical protein HC922_09685 [Leptolyngbyaceae cyanobacterium SM2_3_12]|nr:hypothetical protein [Leptolyngbyaceae cyanobacterium SM2_3_12]